MCANCGYPAAQGHWTEAGTASAPDRLRARFRRAEILKGLLPAYGLTAHDDGVIPGVTVSTRTGDHLMAADLAELWGAAERLAGRPFDPLDPAFVCDDAQSADSGGEGTGGG